MSNYPEIIKLISCITEPNVTTHWRGICAIHAISVGNDKTLSRKKNWKVLKHSSYFLEKRRLELVFRSLASKCRPIFAFWETELTKVGQVHSNQNILATNSVRTDCPRFPLQKHKHFEPKASPCFMFCFVGLFSSVILFCAHGMQTPPLVIAQANFLSWFWCMKPPYADPQQNLKHRIKKRRTEKLSTKNIPLSRKTLAYWTGDSTCLFL